MKKSPTRLVLVCGLPASDTTTLARELATSIAVVGLNKGDWATQLGQDVSNDSSRVELKAP